MLLAYYLFLEEGRASRKNDAHPEVFLRKMVMILYVYEKLFLNLLRDPTFGGFCKKAS